MSELPFIACLCPTFRRPSRLIENAIACFLAQTYPVDKRRLIVLDDSGELEPVEQDNWCVVTTSARYSSLPEKYHAMVELAGEVDAYCVWEDDDTYLPWHLEAHAWGLVQKPWSHPSRAIALTTGKPVVEDATGRLHASLAFTREAYDATGGWPRTKRQDFDFQVLARLRSHFGPPADPSQFAGPSYVFRWASTGSPHGQNFMGAAWSEDWWDRAGEEIPPQGSGRVLSPKLDAESAGLYRMYEELHVRNSLVKGE
jgi:hypothetical protein